MTTSEAVPGGGEAGPLPFDTSKAHQAMPLSLLPETGMRSTVSRRASCAAARAAAGQGFEISWIAVHALGCVMIQDLSRAAVPRSFRPVCAGTAARSTEAKRLRAHQARIYDCLPGGCFL
jgi:hypothetical protein